MFDLQRPKVSVFVSDFERQRKYLLGKQKGKEKVGCLVTHKIMYTKKNNKTLKNVFLKVECITG